MSSVSRVPSLILRVPLEALELVELRLWELGATGLEERDETTIVREAGQGEVVVIASFAEESEADAALECFHGEHQAELMYAPERDWAVEWRRGFGPQRIGQRVVLHPSWEPVQSEAGDVVVTIDPENAFGSGDHETTRLVLRFLDEGIAGGERVLDVGCGSGILSIAALRLGASSSIAIDIEQDAVDVTRRNAEINHVASRIVASTRPLAHVEGEYDWVLANIETRILVDMPDALRGRLAPGGALVLSGILRNERDTVLRAYEPMSVETLLEEGQWCALLLREAER